MGETKKKENKKHPKEFIFQAKNYKIMCVGLFLIALGFILMAGGGSEDPSVFNPNIFNWQRIRLAPTLILIGFAFQIYAILSPSTRKSINQ